MGNPYFGTGEKSQLALSLVPLYVEERRKRRVSVAAYAREHGVNNTTMTLFVSMYDEFPDLFAQLARGEISYSAARFQLTAARKARDAALTDDIVLGAIREGLDDGEIVRSLGATLVRVQSLRRRRAEATRAADSIATALDAICMDIEDIDVPYVDREDARHAGDRIASAAWKLRKFTSRLKQRGKYSNVSEDQPAQPDRTEDHPAERAAPGEGGGHPDELSPAAAPGVPGEPAGE